MEKEGSGEGKRANEKKKKKLEAGLACAYVYNLQAYPQSFTIPIVVAI